MIECTFTENVAVVEENKNNYRDIDWYYTLSSMPEYADINPYQLKRQVELEALMRAEGLARQESEALKARQKGIESQTSYGRVLLSNYVHRVALEVESLMAVIKTGKPGCSNNQLRYIKDMESHVVAYLALKSIIDLITTGPSLQTAAIGIGVKLEDECRCRFFEEKAKEAYKIAMHKERFCSQAHQKRAAISAMMTAVEDGRYSGTPNPDLAWPSWSLSVKTGIGVKLIQAVVKTTGIIKVELSAHKSKRYQQLYYVKPQPALEAWIQEWVSKTGLVAPSYMPCVIPPKSFTKPSNGGYHTGQVRELPLIKVNDHGYYDTISAPENIERMSQVYEAVNLAQNTAWRINTRVLDVLKELWEKNIPVECLPRQEDYPLPVCPCCRRPITENVDGEGKHLCLINDPDALRQWKKHATLVHTANSSAFSKRLAIHKILWIAEKYRDDPQIYFPYQLDFRGRLYAVPQVLNPQGADSAKGLLLFSCPKPIQSKTASDWLAIHVANTAGQDKLSFADRVQWVEDSTPMIHAIAEDPIENRRYWTNADSPFCFLAACFEWSAFKKHGYGYMSTLPIAQDGTCSGLQHYSAILRDNVGGAAVNLIPADKPQDIYQVVADKVITVLNGYTLHNTSKEDYTLARQWLCSGLITRKITKRAVMTLPYGSTLFSAKRYIRDYVEEVREKNPELVPWPLVREVMSVSKYNQTAYEEGVDSVNLADPTGVACAWLGNIVWSCIHSTVIAASEAMDWLQKVANVVSGNAGLPVSWVTPTGFIVLQRYNSSKARRIKTQLAGELVYKSDTDNKKALKRVISAAYNTTFTTKNIEIFLTLLEETDQLDVKGQRQGIAPNFIHSMDASALIYAVIYASRHHNIKDFALIHDSFATHAGGDGKGDAERLAESIRTSFIEMYEQHDVLAEFESQIKSCVQGKTLLCSIPSRPDKGTLNLQNVANSKYFFS